jgi:hypothetical protein
MRDALNRQFDVVLAESLDRFSRDQEDTAGLFKRLTFAGVNIVTLAEGDITHLHIGFKGTMNALFLKDLAEKTHRGLRGRVESGKAGGGLGYGYRVVKSLAGGTLTTGERAIEPGEAAIVERIFREYIAGVAPKAIAKRLNHDGIAGPFSGTWSPSTIHGNPKRGTGVLNNGRKKLVESIMEGVPASEVKDELHTNAARRKELEAKLAAADAPPPLLHPEMAGLYRQKVTRLAQAIEHPETRTEASGALRGLIDAIVLTPNQGELQIELKGNLAAMLGAAQNAKRSPETGDLSLQVVMVAGGGFEPPTFGL